MMSHDPKTDQVVNEKMVGPHDFIFVPTMEMEPHSIKNLSDKENVTLLCRIANVYEGNCNCI